MTNITTCGIDISKDNLDVASYPVGETNKFPNNSKGHKQFLKWLQNRDIQLIVFEPTSAYHRALEGLLTAQNLIFAKVNPYQAKRFGDASGKRAKTDRMDAIMLARLGAVMEPAPSLAKHNTLIEIHEFLIARQALLKDRTAAKNRLQMQTISLLKRQINQRLKQIDKDIASIDKTCLQLITDDPLLHQRFEILCSVPGIGTNTAMILLAEMPELGTLDKRQTAALAGLAPMARESGSWKGQSTIKGGRSQIRCALYMPAMSAIRHNSTLKAIYQNLREAGKPFKVAITAIMRRILTYANAVMRDNRKWNENLT